MTRYLIIPVALIIAASCPGCATSGNPAVQREELVSQIKIEMSTKDDVRRLFGLPNAVSRSSGTVLPGIAGIPSQNSIVETWSYSYMNVETSPVTFIPIIGLFAGSATAEISSLTVQFDDKGIVRHITTSQTRSESGPGASSSQQ